MLTIASLLSVLLFTFHLTDDIVRGGEPGGLSNLVGGSLIMVVWLYGALVLAERRSGYVILLNDLGASAVESQNRKPDPGFGFLLAILPPSGVQSVRGEAE
jgi:hypothetical protein